jgi:hypothetical protein
MISITYNTGNKIIGAPLGTKFTKYMLKSLNILTKLKTTNKHNLPNTILGIEVPNTIFPGINLNKFIVTNKKNNNNSNENKTRI